MKKLKVATILLFLLLIMIVSMPSRIYAGNVIWNPSSGHTAGEIVTEAGKFIQKGESNAESKISTKELQSLSNMIYNILLVTGIIIAIIVGLVMGIKFIMGSIEEKAQIKEMLIPYILGCVVVFGAFAIWQIVVNLLQTT